MRSPRAGETPRPAARHPPPPRRPANAVELAAVIDRPDALAARVEAARPVVGHRIGGPAVPQLFDDRHEFLAAPVTVGMADLAVAAVIPRRRGQPRGDDVPGGAAVADVVDR